MYYSFGISSRKQEDEYTKDSRVVKYLTISNKTAIQAPAQMTAGKEAVGLSRVHMYESKCILSLLDKCLFRY